jgi:hypothetical protein
LASGRNSTLTWLLKESLGGNAKTCMLATISPADVHHDETVSTLKYAERVKKVSNYVVINEHSNVLRLDLEAEVTRLRRQVQQLRESERPDPQVGGRQGAWRVMPFWHDPGLDFCRFCQAGWQPGHLRGFSLAGREEDMASPISSVYSSVSRDHRSLGMSSSKIALLGDEIDTSSPRLINLNQDPLFSETVTYYIAEGVTVIGSDPNGSDIHLSGDDIKPRHCCLTNSGGLVTIYPFSDDCTTYVNGRLVSTPSGSLARRAGGVSELRPIALPPHSRLILGKHHIFRFDQGSGPDDGPPITWELAHRELLESHILDGVGANASPSRPLSVTAEGLLPDDDGQGLGLGVGGGAGGGRRARAWAPDEDLWRSERRFARMKLRARLAGECVCMGEMLGGPNEQGVTWGVCPLRCTLADEKAPSRRGGDFKGHGAYEDGLGNEEVSSLGGATASSLDCSDSESLRDGTNYAQVPGGGTRGGDRSDYLYEPGPPSADLPLGALVSPFQGPDLGDEESAALTCIDFCSGVIGAAESRPSSRSWRVEPTGVHLSGDSAGDGASARGAGRERAGRDQPSLSR